MQKKRCIPKKIFYLIIQQLVHSKKSNMSLLLITINGKNQLHNTQNLHCVETVNGQTQISFRRAGIPSITSGISQTLSQIYAQQNTSGKNLQMLLLTRREDSKQVIYFTHDLETAVRVTKSIFLPDGINKTTITTTELSFKLSGKYITHRVDVNEDLATIMAQQGTSKDLNMMLVTQLNTNKQFIHNRKRVKVIYSENGGSKIELAVSTVFYAIESPAAIQSALPQ
jgi:hypothetical protein